MDDKEKRDKDLLKTVQVQFTGAGQAFPVKKERAIGPETEDQALWPAIRNRTLAISSSRHTKFIERVLCKDDKLDERNLCGKEKEYGDADADAEGTAKEKVLRDEKEKLDHHFHGVNAYELLKVATEAFLLLECGVFIDERKEGKEGKALFRGSKEVPRLPNWPVTEDSEGEPSIDIGIIEGRLKTYLAKGLPYIDRIVESLRDYAETPFCTGLIQGRVDCPCLLELIWSYWHEEAMLVQSLNAISMRFQNKRSAGGHDPLAHLDLSPLRPLNNFIWGYIQDEAQRLTLPRRAYEYDHHYGLKLIGKAVPTLRSVDSRSKFIEAFHSLLHLASTYYRDAADTNVLPDGFPLLNGLKEVHLLLAHGAHNQYGDLPWTARAEMLIQQWLLGRQEMQRFLAGRAMVPYPEVWMDRVDTMNKLQGWTDVSVRHFHDLAVFGEQILLSIRLGDWSVETDDNRAKNWAEYWRQEIRGYVHAYRAVTGVDLAADVQHTQDSAARNTQPSAHLSRRLAKQKRS